MGWEDVKKLLSGMPFSEYPYVVRCEGTRVQGWQVRIPPWLNSTKPPRLFSDFNHGGRDQALTAALVYRTDVFGDRLPPEPAPKPRHTKQSNNTSGLVGVVMERHRTLGRPGQTEDRDTGHLYWAALGGSTSTGGQKKVRFAVKKHGFVEAWEKAVAKRQQITGRKFTASELAKGRLYCLKKWGDLLAKGIPVSP